MTKKQLKNKITDPFYFIKEILGIAGITADQTELVNSVLANKYTAAQSAHSVGKTFIAAILALWFLITNKDSIVITTAPTGRQVKDLLWRSINDLHAKSKYPLGGNMLTLDYNISEKWFATGISPQPGKETESAVTMQGYHAPKIFVIIDEANGIHTSIWEAVDGITNSEGSKVLAIGNPQTINSKFYNKIITKEYSSVKISALTHPNVINNKTVIPGAVSYEWVKDKINKWCEEVFEMDSDLKTFEFEGKIYKPNSLFLWKVLGEFPEDSTDGLISLSSIQSAMSREHTPNGHVNGAVDVARFGTDSTVFCFEINGRYIYEKFFHFDIAKLTGKAIQLIDKYKPVRFGVDCDGLGAGLYDNLNELVNEKKLSCELYEIHGGASPIDLNQTEEFLNLRSQMYWLFKNDINLISLPYSEELETGLSSIKYFFNSKSKIQLESKDEIKKRISRSPDEEDASVYCNFMKYSLSPEIKISFV